MCANTMIGVLFFGWAMFAAIDWLYSKIPVRFPEIRICLSEGGIGWVAGLLDRLHFPHFGLAAILGFVGGKMLLAKWVEVPVALSLGIIVVIVAAATAASLINTRTSHA